MKREARRGSGGGEEERGRDKLELARLTLAIRESEAGAKAETAVNSKREMGILTKVGSER